jgi:hypothetical protein
MLTRIWLIRGLIVLALAVPISLIAFAPWRPPIDVEADLRRVYKAIPECCLYDKLSEWSGLRARDATPAEAAFLRRAVESAPGLARVWCGRYADYLRSAPPQTYKFPDGLRWVRLSHPADRNRWIGLGVRDMYNTGWTAHAILCHVPVGFSPNP